ncbi:RagB/SusD family nutrient uptake outer membrane protein [Aquimarina sp. AD1]|uniref:RagB/SusD family nutrient uptake outer membrane protein n=1 Tax=Aquimarina sp. (strain AD1) TaxID=1714848 RepID=UPI000E4E0FD6|nr:RagB/SusD family nutrient uptake outer membrane protein [Aquimarina sp. AD1]AXT55937.1 RagB/SusD family nutrient uptake outer membrane protein [Aquimarina sp. AD1]RKN37692.1 RagB/SusD family nutrient uptake outer membrane protein [Aquimarina sp. AD1]
MKINIRTNYFKYLMLMISIITLNSCTSDLEQSPRDDSVFIDEEFYSDPSSYEQAIAGVYGNFSLTGLTGPTSSNIGGLDAGTSQYGRGIMNMQIFSTDEIVWTYINDESGFIDDLQTSTWTGANTIIRGFFSRAMYSVALSNEFLRQTTGDKLDSRGVSGELRTEIAAYRAEARLIRALAYYHLMDSYGRAPLYSENDPVGNVQGPEMDRQQLFEFIETELLAIEPELIDPRQNQYGRGDKAVAWTILAKMYLNAEVYIATNRYSDCITYCERIINGGYTLANNYKDLFRGDNDSNQAANEIIFPFIADGQFTQNFGPTTVMTNGAVGSLEQNGENLGVSAGGWGGAIRISPQFAEKFDDAAFTNDDRNTLIKDDRTAEITNITDPATGFVLEKFTNVTTTGDTGTDANNTFSDVDFPLFRLADIYLMYAEANLRGGGGDPNTALGYINDLRNRSNASTVVSSDVDLDFIIDERARELYWEGHRRQDLIRFGLFSGGGYNWALKGNSQNGISIPAFRNLFPVPDAARAANQNLGQNPGY